MAISLDKYIDIQSGIGGAAVATRREMIARIFTKNTVLKDYKVGDVSCNGRIEITEADDALEIFGKDSDEYAFAVKYFGFCSKSITAATKMSYFYYGDNSESPLEALKRADEETDNFGSFAFLATMTADEIAAVAKHNATYNFKYLYSVGAKKADIQSILSKCGGVSGMVLTIDEPDADNKKHYAFVMPMVLFASTRYDRANATKNFMYQQFDDMNVTVSTKMEADRYDMFDIGGGIKYPVNYYGCTHQAGDSIAFYQDGYNISPKEETSVYCNEVWMKDALLVEILNLFLTVEKVPANGFGQAMVKSAMLPVINEAIANGTICVDKNLTQVQKTYIDTVANEENAWTNVHADGYWLRIDTKPTTNGGRSKYVIDYTLIYSKGDSIRKVEGRNILV